MEFNPIRVAFQNWSIGRSLRSCCGNGLHILVWKNQTTPAIHTFWQHGTCITSWKPILLQMIFTWDARGLIHRVLCQTMLPASLCRKRLGGLDAQECELCNMTLDASIWADIVSRKACQSIWTITKQTACGWPGFRREIVRQSIYARFATCTQHLLWITITI